MAHHECFGEGLGGFEPSGSLGRAEDALALCRQTIHQAIGQRRFRADDDQSAGGGGQPGGKLIGIGDEGGAMAVLLQLPADAVPSSRPARRPA